ncbi:MAG: transaldolase [Rhodospirillales bacterium]|nr:transaldolase [Rhodospirillales bacterium]
MRFFIDSADPGQWERFMKRGWVYGATTNPLILQREGRRCHFETYAQLVGEARALGLHELHIQATGTDAGTIEDCGRSIAGLWDRVVVKVALTGAGLDAAARLRRDAIPVTLTAAYAAHQMIPAMTMEAAYIAPYFGRLMEAGEDGFAILERMRTMRDRAGSSTRTLVASLRNVDQIERLAAAGQDAFTVSPAVAGDLGPSEASDTAAEAFERAATFDHTPSSPERR